MFIYVNIYDFFSFTFAFLHCSLIVDDEYMPRYFQNGSGGLIIGISYSKKSWISRQDRKSFGCLGTKFLSYFIDSKMLAPKTNVLLKITVIRKHYVIV